MVAGQGRATFRLLRAPMVWLEPDPLMAGVLALVGRRYALADAYAAAELGAVFERCGLQMAYRAHDWIEKDIMPSGLFRGVKMPRHDETVRLGATSYGALVSTFSPFRRLEIDQQDALRSAVSDTVRTLGGTVSLRLQTTLTLARDA